MKVRAAIDGIFAVRIHQFLQSDGRWVNCGGGGRCRECNREKMERYMADETKSLIRAVLEEHIGPAAKEIGDQDDLGGLGKTIEWVNVAIALETEFDVSISEIALSKCGTIDQMARLIDLLVASKRASPH